jgi:hypothetical protein
MFKTILGTLLILSLSCLAQEAKKTVAQQADDLNAQVEAVEKMKLAVVMKKENLKKIKKLADTPNYIGNAAAPARLDIWYKVINDKNNNFEFKGTTFVGQKFNKLSN